MKTRTVYYIEFWSPKSDPDNSSPYSWGGAYPSLQDALDAAQRLEKEKPDAFGSIIYRRVEKWVDDEDGLYYGYGSRCGYWENADEEDVDYNLKGEVIS